MLFQNTGLYEIWAALSLNSKVLIEDLLNASSLEYPLNPCKQVDSILIFEDTDSKGSLWAATI